MENLNAWSTLPSGPYNDLCVQKRHKILVYDPHTSTFDELENIQMLINTLRDIM